MGLINTIIIPNPPNCPVCGNSLKDRPDGWHTQSKYLNDRMNTWKMGDKITLYDGHLIFEAKGNDSWKDGCGSCNYCRTFFDIHFTIKEGRLKNYKIIKPKKTINHCIYCPEKKPAHIGSVCKECYERRTK